MTPTLIREGWRDLVARLTGSRVLWGLCAILAVLCIVAAARLVLLLISEPQLSGVRFPAATDDRGSGRPFAIYPGQESVQGSEDLDVARIDAQLLGIVTRGERALASIAVDGEKDRIYAPGDRLAPSVVVERVLPRSVVVREQGQLRRIPLASLVEEGASLVGAAADTGVDSESPPASLSQTLTPVLTEDGSTGFRIERLDAGMAESGPVAAGDVVVAVEGQPLAALMDDSAARKRLMSRDTLTVTVLRDGRELDLSLKARNLSRWLNR